MRSRFSRSIRGGGEGGGHGFFRFPRRGRRREVGVVGSSARGDDQGGERRVVRERVAAGAPDLSLHGDRDRLRTTDRSRRRRVEEREEQEGGNERIGAGDASGENHSA